MSVGFGGHNPPFLLKTHMAAQARTEFASALSAIAKERGLDPAIVLDTIKQAILAAYRRDARERGEETEEIQLEANVDSQTGEARVLTWEEGKEDEKKDITPPGFGRIAAQTAKQVILQKIREAEKDSVLSQYETRIGSLVSGIVLRFDGPAVRVDIGRAEGIVPSNERIPSERLNINQRLTYLLKEIRETERGREIILSRSDPDLVKKLFAREVPEIGSGAVEVKVIAREAGSRTKIAVHSTQPGVDPVGSCVGQKGVRVQAVINELNGEKIDIIPWTENTADLIAAALAPADGIQVSLDEKNKEAKVKVGEDKLSLAIGKEGQNVRLAVKLTGWRIEIDGIPVEKTPTEETTQVVPADDQAAPVIEEALVEETPTPEPEQKEG
ncbi:MAG: N utilization substance protein A [Microgenomates group bacterium Gr01-1014_5]|nr:MAG: N utilization substance protein A [Microgenomates group bacterium Gr01-1014_5]